MFEDKTLKCKECGAEFVFTAGEQEFYAEKGFENEPARCRDCRDKRRRSVNTSLLSAPTAAAKLASRLSPRPTVRSTAASASPR